MSRSSRLDYLVSNLELLLKLGRNPLEAIRQAVLDYKYVYLGTDDRSELARASVVVLRQLKGVPDRRKYRKYRRVSCKLINP